MGKKDKGTKEFENYLTYCKKRFKCKVHCLHTDGGAKYKVVDFFCKRSGVGRQVSEAENQDSNGKAERMHQTMMDMVPSMVFGFGLPLKFWVDAALYASYILHRSPKWGNVGRAPPIEVLTGIKSKLTDIVIFGSPCTDI